MKDSPDLESFRLGFILNRQQQPKNDGKQNNSNEENRPLMRRGNGEVEIGREGDEARSEGGPDGQRY